MKKKISKLKTGAQEIKLGPKHDSVDYIGRKKSKRQ